MSEQHYHQAISDEHARQTIRTIPELKRESLREELAAVSLLDGLDIDNRPTFAIQMQVELANSADTPLELVYCNSAFTDAPGLRAKVVGQSDEANVFVEYDASQVAFRKWLRGVVDEFDISRRGSAYMFDGFIWTVIRVQSCKVASGLQTSLLWPDSAPRKHLQIPLKPPKNMPVQGRAPKLPPAPDPQQGSRSDVPASSAKVKYGPYGFTLPDTPTSILSDHIRYFRTVEWAQTSLGPMDVWPPELRNVVNLCLNDINPCMLLWGRDVIMIYNEAYVQLIGIMHPHAMGRSAREIASDYWHTFQPLVDRVNDTGQAVCDTDIPIFVDRHGFLEETYWSFQLIPVLDSHGFVAGYYHPLFETTRYNLLRHRVSSLVELGSQTAKTRTLQSYWDLALYSLTLNNKDVPFAVLYGAESQCNPNIAPLQSPGSMPPTEHYVLKGAIGLDSNHAIAPQSVDIQQGAYVLQPFLIQAIKSRGASIVHLDEIGLSQSDLNGIHWKGYGDPCRTAVVCPLLLTTGEQAEGFLIIGINPSRPFDGEYQQFVQVMLRLLTTSLASVVLFDEEVHQKEKAIGQAAELQEQLLAELQMKEKRFQRFAERSDVAIFIMDAAGNYTYRNQRWYDMFEVAVDDRDVMGAWLNIAFPEDIAKCEELFRKLVMEKEAVCFELKTKMRWSPPSEISEPERGSVNHPRWILCSAYPELDHNGEIIEIVGNVTDISKQKWAEGIQKLRTDSALESKLHLEHFIDTTSHEMRNPLSAIIQSADAILDSYDPVTPNPWPALFEQTLDAAQTIAQCAQHMRHIVDDILTISKLDSGLLVITPIDAQPEKIAEHAVKMFKAEAKAARVELSFVVDQKYRDMGVEWVSLDPTRLLQILINLLTNAIKFTRLEEIRAVTVVLSASVEAPVSVPGGVQFNEEKLVGEDHHLKDDWKRDTDLIFIQFSVTDTGRGLSEDERGSLFNRFSQASPRTHIHYGGSGLGLFISRRLTELQGGSIGLASKSKEGSTFSFYIKTRRIKPVMVRKGSLPRVLPEDIRHRAGAALSNLKRPPPPIHTSSYHHDIRSDSNPSSPKRSRQPPLYRRPSLSQLESRPSQSISPNAQAPKITKTTHNTLHVLVVEDNLVNQRVLATQLRNAGCIVSVANHGREALDHLEQTVHWNHGPQTPDSTAHHCTPFTEPLPSPHSEVSSSPLNLSVILMDWEMPIMNGLEAVAQIRRLESNGTLKGRVPVIGVTANVRQQQIETAITAGMDDVVGKPFRVAELMVKMKGIIADVARRRDTHEVPA
ncbi:hypothetical protein GQ44DRAFT_689557 [Phaeosphaeriaceae sp. PMI808]|nr:hypothetical protein GQ44DRAFT_689557 [Phaeosphaeriaceae sp. PMI808]